MPRRLLAALLGALVVAAACGDAGEPEPGATPTTAAAPTASAPADAEVPVDGAPADTSGDGPGTSTPTPTPATGDVPPPAGDGHAAPAAPAPGPVGAYAAWYLRPSAARSVVVEVLAQAGAGPRSSTVERAAGVLAQVSGKEVTLATGALDGTGRAWSAAELRSLADAHATPQSVDRAVLTLLFLHGGFAENERAVGVAVRSDVAAVFADRVDEAAGVLGDRAAVEDAVTMHEVGHLLGLVDIVLDTGRADPEHPGHSPNRGSVMYHAVESTLLGSLLSGGPPRDFDQADLDDLARIRNG